MPMFPDLACEVIEKLANNKLAYHLEKCNLFSDFQYGLWLRPLVFLFNCRSSDSCIK